MIKLFKDGDRMAISTTLTDETLFIDQFSEIIAEMINMGDYDNDWDFQLKHWLPALVNICCKLRGYKADVQEERLITAGRLPNNEDSIASLINGAIQIGTEDQRLGELIDAVQDSNKDLGPLKPSPLKPSPLEG